MLVGGQDGCPRMTILGSTILANMGRDARKERLRGPGTSPNMHQHPNDRNRTAMQ